MEGIMQIIKENREFENNWDFFNFEERRIIIKDFQKRLYELNNKNFEL